VTPSNSAGNGNAASSTITIGGGGGGPINCPGYATTWTVDAQWLGGVGWVYNTWGNNPEFGSQDMYVVRIAVPAGVNATGFGSMNAIENNGPPAGRYGSLSTLPCDLTGTGLIVKTDGVAPAFTPANGNAPPAINIWVGTAQAKHTVLLQGGVTYYYNITNFNLGTGASTCIPGPTCDMRFTLFKPPGT
jgi:hypothetical protein